MRSAGVIRECDIQAPERLESHVLKFSPNKPDPTMDKSYVDLAIHSMIMDAVTAGEEIWPINKRLFREAETTPLVDEIRIDKTAVIRLLGNKM